MGSKVSYRIGVAASFFLLVILLSIWLFKGEGGGFFSSDKLNEEVIIDGELESRQNKAETPAPAGIVGKGENRKYVLEDRPGIERIGQDKKNGWKVVTWNGKPAKGATVRATIITKNLIRDWVSGVEGSEQSGPEIIEGVCDSEGEFDLMNIEHAVYAVIAEKPGFAPDSKILDLTGVWPARFELNLGQSKDIKGVVLDSEGEPVENVDVWCCRGFSGDIVQLPMDLACEVLVFSKTRRTFKDGTFIIEDTRSWENTFIEIDHAPYMTLFRNAQFFDYRVQEFVLKKPCGLEGVVVDKKGVPVAGAHVSYRIPGNPPLKGGELTTGDNGYYLFEEAPEGYVLLSAVHQNYGNVSEKVALSSNLINEKNLVLPDGAKLKVRVVDSLKKSIEGMIVYVKDVDTGNILISDVTDDNGVVVVKGLNIGDMISLVVWKPDAEFPIKNEFRKVKEDEDVEIVLTRKSEIYLKVLDIVTQDTIKNYDVCISAYDSNSGIQELRSFDGSAIVSNYESSEEGNAFYLAPGEVTDVTIHAKGYLPRRVAIVENNHDKGNMSVKTVYLKKNHDLMGIVVSKLDGIPISGALVECYLTGRIFKKPAFVQSGTRSYVTSNDGKFSVDGMADERCFLKVTAAGYAPAVVDTGRFDVSKNQDYNVVKLSKGGAITGIVYDNDGDPLEGVTIQARIPGTYDCISSTTNILGRYFIDCVPGGEIDVFSEDQMVSFMTRTQSKLKKTVQLMPSQVITVDFNYEGTSEIFGHCTIEGYPAEWGMEISMIDDKGEVFIESSPAYSGYYKIKNIPCGNYILLAQSAISGVGGYVKRPLSISPNESKKVDIDLSGESVYGKVTGVDGNGIQYSIVELRAIDSNCTQRTITDQGGNFKILSVGEGEYIVSAKAEKYAESVKGPIIVGSGYPSKRVDFKLNLGGTIRVIVNDVNMKPVPGSKVVVSQGYEVGIRREKKTDQYGVALFDSLGVDTVRVLAGGNGYTPSGAFANVAPSQAVDCELTIVKGGKLVVEASLPNGAPLANAFVRIDEWSVLGLFPKNLLDLGFLCVSDKKLRTDMLGSLELYPLPIGKCKISVIKGNQSAYSSVRVVSGETATVRLRVQ